MNSILINQDAAELHFDHLFYCGFAHAMTLNAIEEGDFEYANFLQDVVNAGFGLHYHTDQMRPCLVEVEDEA